MTPTEFTKTRVRLADVAEAVKYSAKYRRGDVVANGVVLVTLLLAGALAASGWGLALALLPLPLIAYARVVVASATGVRDARDFLAYIDGIEFDDAEDGDADVIPIRLRVNEQEADL